VIALPWPSEAADRRLAAAPRLVPFVKWPGGKSGEIVEIAVASPSIGGRFIDPFVGGGSVLLATPSSVPAWANDACRDLVRLYEAAATQDQAARAGLEALADAWDAFGSLRALYDELADAFRRDERHAAAEALARHEVQLSSLVGAAGPGLVGPYLTDVAGFIPAKFRRMRQVQASVGQPLSAHDLVANIEGAVRAGFYMAVRRRYNTARVSSRWDHLRLADFLFLREFAYAAMFRFNSRDEFNVPYGGLTYNRKSLRLKVEAMFSEPMASRLAATEWRNLDFEPFLQEAAPGPDDFVFVDPPYDSDFSDYDNLRFGWREQLRLRDTLESLPSRVMVVIKDTPMIRDLYGSPRWTIVETSKTYAWTIKSRNDRSATHLTITNY
jgi:DNA adenine methylase